MTDSVVFVPLAGARRPGDWTRDQLAQASMAQHRVTAAEAELQTFLDGLFARGVQGWRNSDRLRELRMRADGARAVRDQVWRELLGPGPV